MRDYYCGFVDESLVNKNITVCGWVNSCRDHGGVIFIDLRDHTGIVQVVCSSENAPLYRKALTIRDEFVLILRGVVLKRDKGLENPKLKTGKIEIKADRIAIENKSKTAPFDMGDSNVSESIRLKYRYLDLRKKRNYEIFSIRNKALSFIRDYFNKNNFLEFSTPNLTKSTPEGSRDYLVPSRVHKSKFYALPQSPQLFKQLLMVAGFDRYFQIATCFRDEDPRADRQPEFTQVDVEVSFATKEYIMKLTENMISNLWREFGYKVHTPFNTISYHNAMEKYGSDKPDMRYELKLTDGNEFFLNSSNSIFAKVANDKKNSRVKLLKVPNGDKVFSRRDIKDLEEFVKKFGARGLGFFQFKSDGLRGPLLKFIDKEAQTALIKKTNLKVGDIVFLGAGNRDIVLDYMGRLRVKIAKDINLIDKDALSFVWVVDFPMFEMQKDGIKASHHPFTMPIDIKNKNIEDIKSLAYDIVLNGLEIGGGSIRIHKEEIQKEVFRILNLSEDDISSQFGFFLEALKYGAPPHGGIALGVDRIIMLLAKSKNIREVIAFPKTLTGQCLLTNSPSSIDKKQLEELNIEIKSHIGK